ncbi:glutamine synthetase 2 cytoplasmic-like [Uloborus diversus]|uniref:glutamine synthetase 2 cytoplasmic-like n=1 Tax=Uloborus diversus TaxID=327109 RepID=UPI002409B116|nr:glutamine synthetase 2 cytoplasmic-like [Uloborus diversus]
METERKYLAKAFLDLPQPKHQVQCQYVWIDGTLKNLRCKSITLGTIPRNPKELPIMEFCGSGTDYEAGNIADIYAKPVKIHKDPFRGGDNRIIFCETYTREGLPTFANNRHRLYTTEEKIQRSWKRSVCQSYSLLRSDGKPLSYMNAAYEPTSKSGFRCGWEIAEAHYRACLYAGVHISSMEPIRNTGQWKYTVGSCSPVALGDDVWMSRFILIRVAEDFGVTVSFDTAPSSILFEPIHIEVIFNTEEIGQQDRKKLIDGLFAKFVTKEQSLKVVTLPNRVLLDHINADADPYSIINKTMDC